jgi:prephenate dehydrogenase
MALASRVPQLIASLLVARLCDVDEATLRLVGQEIRGMTRAVGGSPALCTDILADNPDPVAELLDTFAGDSESAAQVPRRRHLGTRRYSGR